MSQLSRYREQLQALVPLNRLPPERRDELLESAAIREYPAHAFIYRKGDEDEHLYYLLQGTVSLFWQRKPIKEIHDSSAAAKRAFERPGKKRHSIRAETDAVIALVPSEDLAQQMGAAGLLNEASLEVSDIATEKSSNWMIRLLQSALFAQLPARNIQRIFAHMERKEFAADVKVLEQGQPGEYYYVIEKGFCEVTRTTSQHGRDVHLADLKPGDAFGEEALVANRERGATVTMLTDGVLRRLEKTHFKLLIQDPLLKSILPSDATAAIADETRCIDTRYPEEVALSPLPNAINIPFNIIRLQAKRLDKEYEYLVCGGSSQQNAIAAFLLLERGVAVRYLDGSIHELQNHLGSNAVRAADNGPPPRVSNSGASEQPTTTNDSPAQAPEIQSGNSTNRGNKVSTEKAIDRLESTIDRIDRAYLEREQALESTEKVPTADYAQTATGKKLANLIDEMEQSQRLLNNGTTGAEAERAEPGLVGGGLNPTRVDMDVTGGIDRKSHLSETNNPNILLVDTKVPLHADVDLVAGDAEQAVRVDDPLGAMMREFEQKIRSEFSNELKQEVDKVEHRYKLKYLKLQQLAAQEVRKRQVAYKQKVDLHYKKKELQLRKHYHKLMALANKVTAQKAQLQDARRQFEDKLQAANALYKEVEDMRTTLKKHLGGDIDVNVLGARGIPDDVSG